MAEDGQIVVNVAVEASALRRELTEAERLSRRFGSALGDALEAGIVRGASLSDVLKGLASRLSEIALSAALKPVESAFGSLFSGLTRGVLGGVSPVSGSGLAAPAGLQASLGAQSSVASNVSSAAAGVAASPVVVNIATPDAESFRRSEAQVSAALARAVARGRRGM